MREAGDGAPIGSNPQKKSTGRGKHTLRGNQVASSRTITGCAMRHLHEVAAIAVAAGMMCGPALACDNWDFDLRHYNGFPDIAQANGLQVSLDPYQSGVQVSGDAVFDSPTLKADIGGVITGTVIGSQISLKVEWSGQYSAASTCPFDFNGCTKEYHGVGIYEGTIDANGYAQGLNWDFAHPNQKFGWYLVRPLKCADPPPPPPPPKPNPVTAAVERPASNVPQLFNRNTAALERPASAEPNFPPPASSPQAPGSLTTGIFDTDFGRLDLRATEGTYSQSNGHVTVDRAQGNIIRGTWEQSSASKRCRDGRFHGKFVFAFTSDGFTGSYGYCDGPPNDGPWNGRRL